MDNTLTQYFLMILSTVVTAWIIPYSISWLRIKLAEHKLYITSATAEKIMTAASNISYALIMSKGRIDPKFITTTLPELVPAVVDYIKTNVPDSIKSLDLSDEALKNIAITQLTKNVDNAKYTQNALTAG